MHNKIAAEKGKLKMMELNDRITRQQSTIDAQAEEIRRLRIEHRTGIEQWIDSLQNTVRSVADQITVLSEVRAEVEREIVNDMDGDNLERVIKSYLLERRINRLRRM